MTVTTTLPVEMPMLPKLPLGLQTFSELRTKQYVYVDKTRDIVRLLDAGKYLFLARPRRFGKSLLISTLHALFTGQRDLFEGLYIIDKHDWQPRPVIHLDFSTISYAAPDVFQQALSAFVMRTAAEYGLSLAEVFPKEQFLELLRRLVDQTGQQVVVLIDEYDKPIVDYIDQPERARQNRDILREFYGVLKAADPYLHFVFLTGVSKFSRVSIFSGLNNLRDITFAPQFATLLGYTQAELETCFAAHIDDFCANQNMTRAALLVKIQQWYNGYSWNGRDRVYNPFSILNLLIEQRFSNYWFASGTPTFLINLIKTMQVEPSELEQQEVSELVFETYDLDQMNLLALLVQTGYLTIKTVRDDEGRIYTLHYPNTEVKNAFLTHLIASFTTNQLGEIDPLANRLRRALRGERLDEFMNILRAMFAKIPYPLHIPQEAYYHSLFYMILELMGVQVNLEVLTDKGRIDGVLELEDKIYLIEFKYGAVGSQMDALTTHAIQQIRANRYAERFLSDPRRKLLLGVGFTEKEIGYQLVPYEV